MSELSNPGNVFSLADYRSARQSGAVNPEDVIKQEADSSLPQTDLDNQLQAPADVARTESTTSISDPVESSAEIHPLVATTSSLDVRDSTDRKKIFEANVNRNAILNGRTFEEQLRAQGAFIGGTVMLPGEMAVRSLVRGVTSKFKRRR